MSSLANAILSHDVGRVQQYLSAGVPLDQLDEYGYTPLMEAAIANDMEIARLILFHQPDVNQQDWAGGTALNWAVENANEALCTLLLEAGADPNLYTTASESILVKPLLREQRSLFHLLRERGASLTFAQDFINTKLLGHRFDLVGQVDIVDPKGQFTEVDLEGFFLEFSLGIIRESLEEFRRNYAAKHLSQEFDKLEPVIDALWRASELIRYQHYQTNVNQHLQRIRSLIQHDLVIIPVGYQGHAISLIKHGDYFAICNRRQVNAFTDHLVLGRMRYAKRFNMDLVKRCLYEKNSARFIETELPNWLGLEPVSRLLLKRQISGNCSWANIEAAVPISLCFLWEEAEQMPPILSRKTPALSFYRQWASWDKDRALSFCIQSFYEADAARKASKAALLGAILFQRCGADFQKDLKRAKKILKVLREPGYEYVLQNYIQTYHHYQHSRAGKNLIRILERLEDPLIDVE